MTKQEITELLEHTEQDKIIEFLAGYAARDEHFCKEMKKALLPDDAEGICNINFYRVKAEDCFDFDSNFGSRRGYDYYEAAYTAASELNNILSNASFFIKQGKYAEATAMAMSVAEAIPRNYETVDDSE